MKSRGLVRLSAFAVLVALAGLMGVWASSVSAQPSPCTVGVDCDNEMSVSSGGPVALGVNVDVDVSIDKASIAYAGYGAKITYDNTIIAFVPVGPLNVVYSGLGGMTLDAAATDVAGGDGHITSLGSAKASGTSNATGVAATVRYQCIASGTAALRLIPPNPGPPAINNSTTLGPGGVLLETGLSAGAIVCEEQADVVVAKSGPAAVPAGTAFDWVSTITNNGPQPALGVIIGDNLPENPPDPIPPAPSVPMKVFNSADLTYNAAPAVCAPGYLPLFQHPVTLVWYSNIVLCDLASAGFPVMAAGDVAVLTVNVTAPLYDAGKPNANVTQAGSLLTPDPSEANEADCAIIGLPPENVGCAVTMVLPAMVSIDKVADKAVYSEGDTITWSVTVSCGAAGSPCADATGATGPVIVDTVDANQTVTSATIPGGSCVTTATTATCTPAAPMAAGSSVVATVSALVVDSANNSCTDVATATFADPETVSTPTVSVICLPPTVRMEKDIDTDGTSIIDLSNLWLCEGPTCTGPGQGELTIYELVSNVSNDPDGAGAFEFQLKFDHKIFDIDIEVTDWLSNGVTRTVECDMSVITENWILFGCVSSGPGPGQMANGVAAIIHVTPQPDLKYRLTPGNDNGLVRPLLDENCEIADIWGHPIELPGWANDGIDNDGDTIIDEFGEGLAPGVGSGGMLEVCSDFAATVRILESDLNLDCTVDVLDQQAIAFRYGAFFGTLFYDPWFDLEPWVDDFDIDIKDLQKVWGRDGSTCDVPIPAQPAVALW